MELKLSPSEIRVLGCLLEKEMTTPDHYPMTLNGLTMACNQKTNRNPVVEFSEKDTARAIESLRESKLALRIDTAGGRVPKYRHTLHQVLDAGPAEKAVICLLLLRGPQTTGEIRSRSERMHRFSDLNEVESILKALSEEPAPLLEKLPRQPGQKEIRHLHLLGREEAPQPTPLQTIPLEPASVAAQKERDDERRMEQRVAAIEENLAGLGEEVGRIREAFEAFRKEFE